MWFIVCSHANCSVLLLANATALVHMYTHTHTRTHTHTHTHTHTQEVSLASCQEENKHLSKQSQDLEKMLGAKETKLEQLTHSIDELKDSLSQQGKEKAGLIAKVHDKYA